MKDHTAELISKYLERTITNDELKELEEVILSSDDNKQEFEDVLSAYKKLLIADYSSMDVSEKIAEKKAQIKLKPKRRRLFIRSIAAILIVGIIIGSLFLIPKNSNPVVKIADNSMPVKMIIPKSIEKGVILTTDEGNIEILKTSLDYSKLTASKSVDPLKSVLSSVFVPKGEQFQLILSDGTKLWINSDTYVEYPSVFDDDTRKIKVRGEIYLEVAHDRLKPFIVETYNSEIKVLGTKFNVSAYPEAVNVVTTLVEGSVLVNNENILAPDEQLSFNKHTMKCSVTKIDASSFTDWTNGVYHFDKMSLGDLSLLFNRVYGVEVEIMNDKSIQKVFTGAIHKAIPYNEMFDIIMKTTKIEYIIEKEKITIW